MNKQTSTINYIILGIILFLNYSTLLRILKILSKLFTVEFLNNNKYYYIVLLIISYILSIIIVYFIGVKNIILKENRKIIKIFYILTLILVLLLIQDKFLFDYYINTRGDSSKAIHTFYYSLTSIDTYMSYIFGILLLLLFGVIVYKTKESPLPQE